MTREDFLEEAGISDELADIVTQFVDDPEGFYLLPAEEQQRIEAEVDAVFNRLSFA